MKLLYGELHRRGGDSVLKIVCFWGCWDRLSNDNPPLLPTLLSAALLLQVGIHSPKKLSSLALRKEKRLI